MLLPNRCEPLAKLDTFHICIVQIGQTQPTIAKCDLSHALKLGGVELAKAQICASNPNIVQMDTIKVKSGSKQDCDRISGSSGPFLA
jgi:hypothetical protein